MRIQEVSLYIDFKTDESYTPSKISIKVADSFHELKEVKEIEFDEPVGWFTFRLEDKNSQDEVIKPYIKTMYVQICVLQNQHSGRDTHIRQVKIFAPRDKKNLNDQMPHFSTNEMEQFT